MTNISDLRRDYQRAQLKREDLDANPFVQFKLWLDEAIAADIVDANAMSLATVGKDSLPSLRTVLLKGFTEEGFVFFTNLESTKSQQIRENPNVALLFYWREFERQIKIQGTTERLPMADVARYFLSRPKQSQIAAWASPQSRIIEARQALELKFAELVKQFGDGDIPVPSFWGGFRVVPRSVEFWQGGPNRLHDRFKYTRQSDGWRIDNLAP